MDAMSVGLPYGGELPQPKITENVCAGQIRQVASAELPTQWGSFRILGFERDVTSEDGQTKRETAVALVMGHLNQAAPLLRIHSQCLTGDVLGSLRCDCGAQLELALQMISREGDGILIYEMQEGRGIGLMAKLQAYVLQEKGLDTVEANQHLGLAVDARDYRLPVQILKHLGIKRVRMISNNPDKFAALTNAEIGVVERVPCEVPPEKHARHYLLTKKLKLGHMLAFV
jgi:GTP cyclohydrolase II